MFKRQTMVKWCMDHVLSGKYNFENCIVDGENTPLFKGAISPICCEGDQHGRHVLWNMAQQGPGQKAQTLCRDCCGVSLKALFLILGLHLWVLQVKRCGQTMANLIWLGLLGLATRYISENMSAWKFKQSCVAIWQMWVGIEFSGLFRFFSAAFTRCYQAGPPSWSWLSERPVDISGPCQTWLHDNAAVIHICSSCLLVKCAEKVGISCCLITYRLWGSMRFQLFPHI